MTGLAAKLSGLPLRVRLVAGFSATMLVVLTAAGGFVYWRAEYALDRLINQQLVDAAQVIAPRVSPSGKVRTGGLGQGLDEMYQVVDERGQVLASSAIGDAPLFSAGEVRRAMSGPVRRDIGLLLPINNSPLRAYATALPRAASQQAAVLVVAIRRDNRDEALLELLLQLVLAGLAALFVTAVVGDRLARLALRPVERYRSQAIDIIDGATGVRLDVPVGRDDEVTRLGHTLNTMLDALGAALERERRFVNDASHELRTPLAVLSTRVQLGLRRPRTVAHHEAVLTEIESDVVRLTDLAEELLLLGTGRSPSTPRGPCDLASVAEQEVSRFNESGQGRGGSKVDAPVVARTSVAVPVPLGSTQLARVLGNLLDNANLHGRAPVTVTVDRVAAIGRLVVVDLGQGMDPQTLATATQRFSRSSESLAREGFGLGLSLVESVVTGVGGELRLCYAGRHQQFGPVLALPCEHDNEMTVTVLLPIRGAQPLALDG